MLAVHELQVPTPSQTMFVPQLVPAALLVSSPQTGAPVVQENFPVLQPLLGWQEAPAVQLPQPPTPSQTMFVPQLVPAALLVSSAQIGAPVVQENFPVLQTLLGWQEALSVQLPQLPTPSQTILVPQFVPADLLVSSAQTGAPVVHEIFPVLQPLAG
jgi:hypothetical protein